MQVDLNKLIACPHCDALHDAAPIEPGAIAKCTRCSMTLMAPRADAYARISAFALTNLILMCAALFFPFLSISASGSSNAVSLLDAARAFLDSSLWPFALATAALIIAIPLVRFIAVIYTLWPLVWRRPPYRHARAAFRLALKLEPWSMAEIFILGVGVALIKVADLATISFGIGFWALALLVLVTVLQDGFMSRYMVWTTIDAADPQ